MRKILSLLIVLFFISAPLYADDLARPLQTGQTTSYATGDDGDLELGITKDYTVYTTGQYAGTSNIVINGKTHALSNNCVRDNRTGLMWARYVPTADIGPAANGKLFWEQWTRASHSATFNAAGKTITAAAGYDTEALCAGRKFTVAESVSNNGTYTVANISTTVITTVEALVNEGPVAISIATVADLIWDALDQANANALGGYSDWRIPNYFELPSIVNLGNCDPAIDTTVFPSTPSSSHWTASTNPCGTTNAFYMNFVSGFVSNYTKQANKYYVRFVRGGYGLEIAGNDSTIQMAILDAMPLRIKGTGNSVINVTANSSTVHANESATITNSILWDETGEDLIIANTKTVTGNYNLLDDVAVDGTYTDTGTIFSSDPLFTNAAGGDFTLQAGSPAINAGTPNGSTPYSSAVQDLNGRTITNASGDALPRFGLRLDIGAYEWDEGSGTPRRKGLMRMGPRMRCNYCH